MIATVFLALGMGMAMAQEADNLSITPANREVTATAGSTDFTVATNIAAGDLTVTADTWTEATNAAGWSARNAHASVVFDNKMWVIGGWTGSNDDDVWHSTDGVTWTEVMRIGTAWSARQNHASVVFDNKMWVIGGYDGDEINDVWHSTDGATWTEATDDAAWSAREDHTSVVFDGKMWVIGGLDNGGRDRVNDVWHSTDGVTWTQATANAAWSGRSWHTSVVFDNKMWVIGGDDGSRQDDVWSSTDGIAWTQATANAAWSGRISHASVVFDNKMWVIGGFDNSHQDDVWHSTDGATWTEATADAAWSARDDHTSVAFDNKMWVIGGTDGSRQNDVYFSAGDWLAASLSGTTLTADYEANGIFAPRTGTVTVSGEGLTEMVTVTQAGAVPALALIPTNQDVTATAGSTGFTVTTNIPAADLTIPTTDDAWLTVSLSGTTLTAAYLENSIAAPRTGTVTVSGGGLTEMVTVTQAGAVPELALIPTNQDVTATAGSTDFTVTTNIPAADLTITADTWTEATNAAGWSARDRHTSVVFNNKMWVIGGNDGSVSDDVWQSTNGVTWTEATNAAGWSARDFHTSVVFDNKMWVIGGQAASRLNDVWNSTDGITWTEATANADWSDRTGHTSLVYDNKMWVIGGENSPTNFNDVWSSTDGITWTQATAAAAWSGRFDHTSVVFDNKMWVIGGFDDSDELNDVWSSTDGITWTQATDNAAWSLRNAHTSVVFGGKMWVIGGVDADFILQDDVWHSTDGITWTQATANAAWSGRFDHTSVVFDNKMWVIGGQAASRQDDVYFSGEWLAASLSGTTLTADYGANGIVNVPRTGTITVSGLGLTQTVTVTQAGIPTELALSPANRDVTAATGSTNFTVTTNLSSGDLTTTDDADWLTVSLSGTTLTADYEVNSIAASRTGTVTVTGGGLTKTVTVTQAGAVPELALSPANRDVTAETGSTDFTVTTNVLSGDLTITDDADWLTTELSGTTLTADYEANGIVAVPRTGTITVSGLALTQRVTVTQAGIPIELALSPANQDVSAETGSMDFMVTTNLPSGDLTITDDADWLTVTLSGSDSPYTLTADYEVNSIAGITAPRTGTVTVSGGGLARTVTVTQAGAVPELALSSTRRIVTAEAGNTDFTVTTNLPSDALTITDDADWLTVSLSGTTLTANYEANSITAPRTGMVTVSGGGLTETVTVVQVALVHELALSPATQSVTAEAGRTDFTVTTNVPSGNLTITDDADWLAVSLSGTTLTAAYLANGSTSPRTGTITVSGEGLTETVTVVQAEEGVTFELALSPAMQSVTAEAGSTDFTVTTNLPSDALTITDDADWLTVSLSGTTLTAYYEANSDTGPRTGTITISGGGLTETVTVTQAGAALNLALSPATQNVTAEAGTTDFTVTTNVPSGDLTTTDDADWLTVSLSGTSSPYTLTADYEANEGTDPRTGTVTVSGGGLTETITVTQAQAGVVFELSLSPATQSVTNEAGSTDFMVTTNLQADALTTTDDADWLTVSLSGTSSPYTLTADYEANSDTSPRTGTVTVSGGGLTETVTVTQAQAGVVFELSLSPAVQSVTSEAGTTDFTVTTNVPSDALTTTDDADWLTVSLSGATLTAEYEANSSTSSRTGTVTVSGGGLTETVTVTQAQAGVVFELSLSPATQSVTAEAGSTDFTVTTNVPSGDLTITDDADWLTVILSGTTLTADYEANSDTGPRTGTMTISGGGLTQTVTVEQEGTPLGLADETILVVYPNPGVAQVTVDFGDMAQGEGKEWRLFDPSGRKALSGSVARGETTLVINTQGLLSGLYLFQVRGEGQKSYISHRVVIRH